MKQAEPLQEQSMFGVESSEWEQQFPPVLRLILSQNLLVGPAHPPWFHLQQLQQEQHHNLQIPLFVFLSPFFPLQGVGRGAGPPLDGSQGPVLALGFGPLLKGTTEGVLLPAHLPTFATRA